MFISPKYKGPMKRIVAINKDNRAVFIAATIFTVLGLSLQWWRMQTLNASMDQGILYQILWNSLNGNFFESTLSSQLSTSVVHNGDLPTIGYQRLGQHFTPILIIWLPIIKLFGKWALPFLQVILIALAGLVLYKLARSKLNKRLSSMIAVSFYGANAVIGPCLGNFTDLCQLPLLIFILILAIEYRRKWLTLFIALIIPMVREDTGIVLMGVGLWVLYAYKSQWKLALYLILYGSVSVIAITNFIMPIFSEDNSKRFMVENFGQYLKGDNQASSLEVLKLTIQQPILLIKEILSPPGKTIRYLAGQFLPLAFIPLVSIDIWILMGLPLLGLLIAQGNPLGINWRYTYLVVPGLFSGAVYWWSKNKYIFNIKMVRTLWKSCIALSLIFMLTSNPNKSLSWLVPSSIQPWIFRNPIEQWNHGQAARELLKEIPQNATVAANNPLIPHLADRQVLVRFPAMYKYKDRKKLTHNVNWIALDFDYHYRSAHAFKKHRRDLNYLLEDITKLQKEYSIYKAKSGILIFKLGIDKNPDAEQYLRNLITQASLI